MPNPIETELLKYLKANLLIQLNADEVIKPELLLHRAGFEISEIASILGKEYKTVHMSISRAAKKDGKK